MGVAQKSGMCVGDLGGLTQAWQKDHLQISN